jgi:DNA-binding NarL/FixJ family response regulator
MDDDDLAGLIERVKAGDPDAIRDRGDREVPAPDPTPSQDAQAHDRFAQLVAGRSAQEAEVVELRRRGLTFEEIAAQTGLSERSVRRIIEAIHQRMEARQWR